MPSVRNSYGELDRWIILIDIRAVDIRDELLAITHGLPVQLVNYAGQNIVRTIQIALSDIVYPSQIMTCRVDTDDMIGAGLIKGYRAAEISEEKARDGIVLSFPGGAIFDEMNDVFYFTSYPENPFLCFVEDCNAATDLKTIYAAMHVDMIEHFANNRMLRGFGPQWASVVHDNNIANQSLLGSTRFSYAETDQLKKYFGLRAPSSK